MNITEELRKYAAKNLGLSADASDDDIRKAVSDAITKGDLDLDTLKELTTAKVTEAEKRIAAMIDTQVGKALGPLSEKLDSLSTLMTAPPADTEEEAPSEAPADTKATIDKVLGDIDQVADAPADTKGDAPTPQKAMAMAAAAAGTDGASASDGYDNIRVKAVVEQFDDTRTAATWDKSDSAYAQQYRAGQQIRNATDGPNTHALDMPTHRSLAIAGAWMKHMASQAFRSEGKVVPRGYEMTELDRKLVEYAVHECRFVGPHRWDDRTETADDWFDGDTKVTNDLYRKALLDDTTSGGLQAVPIEFDDVAILTPLLNGELFPYVNIINVTRRRIEGFTVGNPTLSWGTAEGSQISLFNTDTLVAAFDNTIYPVTGAIEIGLDFEADSPVGVGNIIMSNYGERFREEMDNVIATGNGTNRPQGVLNAAGTTVVAPSGGAGTAQTVTDYEGLLFGVAKQYRAQAGRGVNSRAIYIGTETSYSRARSIAVGAADTRRVFGMGVSAHEDYELIGHRYAINSTLANTQILFVCLNRYRMYRRQGFEVRVVTEDKELARKNQRLILVRARFGGKLELGGAAAKITAGLA